MLKTAIEKITLFKKRYFPKAQSTKPEKNITDLYEIRRIPKSPGLKAIFLPAFPPSA